MDHQRTARIQQPLTPMLLMLTKPIACSEKPNASPSIVYPYSACQFYAPSTHTRTSSQLTAAIGWPKKLVPPAYELQDT